ncbi:Protein CBG12899 [Caenorhabditis briggsae]|uniref:DUF281 domain-containing protein n=2 Tax=Caenorhabditis briggsae TaxID=6238 RepID=A0AAE9J045_CAEBR|nr:Protein CBG12899 [Caenorhabditis briggsae]ULU13216.1 hypothetical protein L3Y34_016010 [Caenorhabditis briggsae]CAP31796.2 Protein CBG12899 [Caenorhabditis briggsae]
MLAFNLLFNLCLFNFAESCLKIRYPGPPKCECPSLLLTLLTYKEYDVSGVVLSGVRVMAPPQFVLENCTVSMYCVDDLELVVFDTDRTHQFLNRPADGICDPYTQKWLIGDKDGTLITVNRLYGTCWKLLNPPVTQVPVTPKPACSNCELADFEEQDMHGINFGYLYPYIYTEDGCISMDMICRRTDDLECHDVEIYAQNYDGIFPIASHKNATFASVRLVCDSRGFRLHYNSIMEIGKLTCMFTDCS